ncbi:MULTISPECIES: hypothetical protein [unclassified Enterococcus]|uniref:hypothetical protein n=1 Tax=unclassified Enterococcus TaxID=2608891 RepID=UPI00197D4C52|nr:MULTISPECIES: hypothetical protein [unclassified Enterococcus]
MDSEKQKGQKISLFVKENATDWDKNLDEIIFKLKNPTKKDHEISYINDYISATVDALFANQKEFSNKDHRQHFFENFTNYIPSDKKNWNLWDDFQKVSRSFEELKLENICNNLGVHFDKELTNDDKLKIIGYLNDLKGEITVEIAKINPMTELNFDYDPMRIYAEDQLEDVSHAPSDYYDSEVSYDCYIDRKDFDKYADKLEAKGGIYYVILDIEKQIPSGKEDHFYSKTSDHPAIRYAYYNKESLKGQIFLFDRNLKIADKLPWEREELAEEWKKCKIIPLTPVTQEENTLPKEKLSETRIHQPIHSQQNQQTNKPKRQKHALPDILEIDVKEYKLMRTAQWVAASTSGLVPENLKQSTSEAKQQSRTKENIDMKDPSVIRATHDTKKLKELVVPAVCAATKQKKAEKKKNWLKNLIVCYR